MTSRKDFLATGNPVYAWEAIKYYLEAGEDLPIWVLEYLKNTAQEVYKIETPGKRAGDMLFSALGFTDARQFNSATQKRLAFRLAVYVNEKKEQGESVENACKNAVTELNLTIGWESVKNLYMEGNKQNMRDIGEQMLRSLDSMEGFDAEALLRIKKHLLECMEKDWCYECKDKKIKVKAKSPFR